MAPGKEEAVAAAVRQSPIREQLVAALDDWSWAVSTQMNPVQLKALVQTTKLADPDPWCQELRNPTLWKSTTALKKFAAGAIQNRLSPAKLSQVGLLLRDRRLDAASWLRSALVLHPHDFLLNLELGLWLIQQRHYQEASGFFALPPPSNPVAWPPNKTLPEH